MSILFSVLMITTEESELKNTEIALIEHFLFLTPGALNFAPVLGVKYVLMGKRSCDARLLIVLPGRY